jgi:AraC family transcriptional regulator of adaptative response / DNA-3-methyladenine glycosylase II
VHLPAFDGLVHVVAQVRRAFDLDHDPQPADAHLARDPFLRPFVRARRGMRVPGSFDPLELAVRAILGQQVTVAAATRLAGRIVDAYGARVPGLDALGLTHCFPDAATLADAPLESVGLTRARAAAVRAFAVAAADVPLDGTLALDATVRALRSHPGIGDWTAQYIAMRAGGERDAFPARDLGLRRALGAADDREVAARSEAWRPWRAYAAMHLWTGAPVPAQLRKPRTVAGAMHTVRTRGPVAKTG